MGLFTKCRPCVKLGAPVAGIANGNKPGDLGVWVVWDTKKNATEVFRVSVKATGFDRKIPVTPISYTFAPGFDASFCRSIELPHELKQFLVGSDRAHLGGIALDFVLAGGKTVSASITLSDAVDCLRGKGNLEPSQAARILGSLERDDAKTASIAAADLKAHSESVKKALEEKRLKEEEEKKKKEEERKLALQKAAESKGGAAVSTRPADKNAPSITGGRTAIFYGSSTGNTAEVAKMLKAALGASVDHVKSITDINPIDFTVCENIILGIPTWHIGELQDDWAAMMNDIKALKFEGKKVAVFGLGDGKGYADTYVDAMAELLAPFEKGGAKHFGLWPTAGYEYKASKAIRNGKFLGLVIDVENQDNLSEKRVKEWAAQIKGEMGL